MPAVPVPDTAKVNAPSPARNTLARRLRIASSIAIMAGSRWLSGGAVIARVTRGSTGLGPGPSSRRSGTCGMEERANPFSRLVWKRQERRPGVATREARHLERDLQTRYTKTGRDGTRERRDAMLNRERRVVAAAADVIEHFETRPRQHG